MLAIGMGFVLVAPAQAPEIYQANAAKLAAFKKKVQQGDKKANAWVKHLLKDADAKLAMEPVSVMDKAFVPPSGNKHDYMRMAPYFWPDPTKPDGKPYIRKDGVRNPEIEKISDKKNIVEIGKVTQLMGLGYYFTGDEKYAEQAATLLRVWFIDTATRMNPNLTYAQAVMGVNDGRGIGILETVNLTNVTESIGLLKGAKSWTAQYDAALREWFRQYLDWMLNSKNGKDEHNSKNNHGIWYDMQVLSFSLFLHQDAFAKQYVQSTLQRIPVQFEPDGRQPLELERTTALGYSTFSLSAWFKAASLAEHLGTDIWQYQTADGRSIRKALDWLLPYALGDQPWTYQQIHPYYEIDVLYYLLLQAYTHYKDDKYYAAAMRIQPKADNVVVDILYDK